MMRDRKALIVEQIPRPRRYARALTGAQPLAPAEYLAGPAKIAILADYEGLVADVAARGGRCRRATSPLEPTNCSTDSGRRGQRRGEIQHHHPRRRIEAVGVDETLTLRIAKLSFPSTASSRPIGFSSSSASSMIAGAPAVTSWVSWRPPGRRQPLTRSASRSRRQAVAAP